MISEETVTRLIAANTASLQSEIRALRQSLQDLTTQSLITEYAKQTIDENIPCTETLDVIKSLPEFSGVNINSYVSWREAANNSISLYVKGSRKYFAALTILRNKIVQNANDILTNHGTVLNYDAIIARLDFAYADKRPTHIIEQELSILRQGSKSIIDFYNEVNKKLTLLTNKTIMTHGTDSPLTKELNSANRRNALRIFITGLNAPLSNILFSLSPEDLPSALAKAQELESNNLRANFALQFDIAKTAQKTNNNKHTKNANHNNLRFPSRNHPNNNDQQPKVDKPEPMEVGSSANKPITWQEQKEFEKKNNRVFGKPHHNRFRNEKRSYESAQHSAQPAEKQERVNNLNEDAFLDQMSDCPTCSEHSEVDE